MAPMRRGREVLGIRPPPHPWPGSNRLRVVNGRSQRTTVGLIALITGILGCGWIGIHKFVMGYSREGINSILISVLTCGIGAGILTIISIAEGIIYLTMSDETFERTYVHGHKGWF